MNNILCIIVILVTFVPYYICADNPDIYEGHTFEHIDISYGEYEAFYYKKKCIEIYAKSSRRFSAYLIKDNETTKSCENDFSCTLKDNSLSKHNHHYTYILVNNDTNFEDTITVDFVHYDCHKKETYDTIIEVSTVFISVFGGGIVIIIISVVIANSCIYCKNLYHRLEDDNNKLISLEEEHIETTYNLEEKDTHIIDHI